MATAIGSADGPASAPSGDRLPTQAERLATLIDDAEYVAAEISRGEAVSGDVLAKLMPQIETLLVAAAKCRRLGDQSWQAEPPYYIPPPLPPGAPPPPLPKAPAIELEAALSAVMAAIAPITVQSLRDTQCVGTGAPGTGFVALLLPFWKAGSEWRKNASLADKFSDRLLYFSLFVLLLALASSVLSLPGLAAPPAPTNKTVTPIKTPRPAPSANPGSHP